MSLQPKIRTWLWGVLIVVLAGGLGFAAWYYNYVVNGTTAPQTSPSPTKTAKTSPTVKVTTTPTSPTNGGQTSTPSGEETATPMPSPTPPSNPPEGWKIEKNYISQGKNINVHADYQLYIRNKWIGHENYHDTFYHATMYYGDDPKCGAYLDELKPEYCLFSIGPSTNNQGADNYYFPVPGTDKFLYIKFNQTITETDKKIVLDSFTVLSD